MVTAGAVASTTSRVIAATSEVFPLVSSAQTLTSMVPPRAAVPETEKLKSRVTEASDCRIGSVSPARLVRFAHVVSQERTEIAIRMSVFGEAVGVLRSSGTARRSPLQSNALQPTATSTAAILLFT